MAYTVLARKYRPRNFSELVGQEHVVQALSNALRSQRLHHAYLFTGTRGVGKTTVSRILAKSLNCVGVDGQGDITDQPCGVCQACTDIDQGRFVDYTELDAASNRGIDEIQSLLEQAVYKPVQGRFKVFMIDEVHMLTNPAFNAMLKTLEEPPEYLKFVLATTDPQKVPVTVLSRCLQFNLRPMPAQTVVDHLQHVLADEAVPFELAALRIIGKAAQGSMRDALSLADQAIAFGAGSLHEEPVRQMLGAVDASHVFNLIQALADNRGADVVAMVDAARLQGLSAATTLDDMSAVLQRMAVLQVTGVGDDSDPDYAQLKTLADAMPADETQLLYSLCLHGRGDLGLAPDEYAALTMILLRLLAFKPGAVQASAEKKSLNNSAVSTDKSVVPSHAVSKPLAATPEEALEIGLRVSSDNDNKAYTQSQTQTQTQPKNKSAAEDADSKTQPIAAQDHGCGEPMQLRGTVAHPSHRDAQFENAASFEPVSVLTPLPTAASAPIAPPATAQLVAPIISPEPIAIAVPTTRMPVRQASNDRVPHVAVDAGASAPPHHDANLRCTPEGDLWLTTVQQLIAQERIGALVRELALQSQLVATDDASQPTHWLLRIERESLNQGANRERLQQAMAQAGIHVQLGIELGVVYDTPAKRLAAQAAQALHEAELVILNDPFAQQMMAEFGATIVPGSLKAIATHTNNAGLET
jgi:DNA polymerase-3 subunit gamma/tau